MEEQVRRICHNYNKTNLSFSAYFEECKLWTQNCRVLLWKCKPSTLKMYSSKPYNNYLLTKCKEQKEDERNKSLAKSFHEIVWNWWRLLGSDIISENILLNRKSRLQESLLNSQYACGGYYHRILPGEISSTKFLCCKLKWHMLIYKATYKIITFYVKYNIQ